MDYKNVVLFLYLYYTCVCVYTYAHIIRAREKNFKKIYKKLLTNILTYNRIIEVALKEIINNKKIKKVKKYC